MSDDDMVRCDHYNHEDCIDNAPSGLSSCLHKKAHKSVHRCLIDQCAGGKMVKCVKVHKGIDIKGILLRAFPGSEVVDVKK